MKEIKKDIKTVMFFIDLISFIFILIVFEFKSIAGNMIKPIMLSFWLMMSFVYFLFFGYKKNKNGQIKRKTLFIFLLGLLIMESISYLIGFKAGFIKIEYNLETFSTFLYTLFIILISEFFRYLLLNNNVNNKLQQRVTFCLFFLSDFLLYNQLNDINLLANILFCIEKELLLTYTSLKFGYQCPIIYRLVIDLMPIIIFYPNLGRYLYLVIMSIFNILVYYFISKPYRKKDMERANFYQSQGIFSLELILLFVVLGGAVLISGQFKYSLTAIASDSMYPALQRGDGIVIEKLSEKQKKDLRVGDIVSFVEDDMIVTHRIIKIEKGKEVKYLTKGDNNDAKDVTKKGKDDIIGIVRMRIPYVGYPSIEINDIKNK